MKKSPRLLFVLISCALVESLIYYPSVEAQGCCYTANRIVGGTKPTTCQKGPPVDVWIDTNTSPPTLNICGPANVWNAQVGPTGVTGATGPAGAAGAAGATGATGPAPNSTAADQIITCTNAASPCTPGVSSARASSTGEIYPTADSTSALTIKNAAKASTLVTFDTTNLSAIFNAGSGAHVAFGWNANSGFFGSGNNTLVNVGGAGQLAIAAGVFVDRTIALGWSDASGISGLTLGTSFTRQSDGNISLGAGSSGSGGSLKLAGIMCGGTKFTLSASVGSAGTTVGGATCGSFVSGTTGTLTVVLTMNGATGLTASNGWACGINNETHPGATNMMGISSHSTTTVTLTGTTIANDVISFGCNGY